MKRFVLILAALVLFQTASAFAAQPDIKLALPAKVRIYHAGQPITPEYPQANESVYGYYLSTAKWPAKTIDVCWDVNDKTFSTYIFDEAMVMAAVQSTWNHFGVVQFTDWQQCPAGKTVGPDSIGLRFEDDGPASNGLGIQINQNTDAVHFNFTYVNWSSYDGQGHLCSQVPYRFHCDALIAIHEFGHVLGLAHEQNRPDTPTSLVSPDGKLCPNDAQGQNGNTEVGQWDLESVMNYCNPQWNGDGHLSEGDLRTIWRMYGDPFIPPPSSNTQSGSSAAMQSSYGNGGVGELDYLGLSGQNVYQFTNQSGSWARGALITDAASAAPQLLQVNYGVGVHPNFEMLVRQGSEVVNYWHNNVDPQMPWHFGGVVAAGATGGYAFAQNPIGNGVLEAFIQQGGAVVHYERVARGDKFVWNRVGTVATGATGDVALAHSPSGGYLLVVAEGSTLRTFTSDANALTWTKGRDVTTSYTGGTIGVQYSLAGAPLVVANADGATELFTSGLPTPSASLGAVTATPHGSTPATVGVPGAPVAPSVPGGTGDGAPAPAPAPLAASGSANTSGHLKGLETLGSWHREAVVSRVALESPSFAVSNLGGGRYEVIGTRDGRTVHLARASAATSGAFTVSSYVR